MNTQTATSKHEFIYLSLKSSLHDPAALNAAALPLAAALDGLGGIRSTAGGAAAALLILTGGTENLALEALAERIDQQAPVLIVAHPGHNSLPAALEILARIHQQGGHGQIAYLSAPDDGAGLAEIASFINRQRVARQLRAARMGVVGQPSDWLIASRPSSADVAGAWGPEVVNVPMGELSAAIRSDTSAELEPWLDGWLAKTSGGRPSHEDFVAAAKVYRGLKQIIACHRLAAITLRCFDLLGTLKTTGCLALARLNDEGIAAGCEGDVPALLTMMWSGAIAGQAAWMANPARIDPVENTLWLAHCTVPTCLAQDFSLASHFESNSGAAIAGIFRPGPVTLARIGGAGLRRVWTAEGEIEASGAAADLCRTQIRIRLLDGQVTELLTSPLGNHLIAVPGWHRAALRRYLAEHGPEPAAANVNLRSRSMET